jgi:hypothetical protein
MFKIGEVWEHSSGYRYKIVAQTAKRTWTLEEINSKERVRHYPLGEPSHKYWKLIIPVTVEEYV